MSSLLSVARERIAHQPSCAPQRRRLFRPLLLLVLGAACATSETTAPVIDPNIAGPAARLEATTADLTLNSVGASEQISVLVRDARNNVLQNAAVNWSSADITIADVAGSGSAAVITARAPGRTVVRAQLGILVKEFAVTVAGARSLAITPANSLLRAGDRLALRAVVDADASARVEVRFQTDNATIVSVSAAGEVLGLAPGLATVRATVVGDPRLSAVALVTVTTARAVRIAPSAVTTWVGDRSTLRAEVEVDSGQSRVIEWRSADASIATVSAAGELIAVGTGTTRVLAVSVADPRARDSVNVQVLPERRVVVSPASASLGAGQTRALSADVSIEGGLSRNVLWRSSNPSIALVSSDGLVTGVSQGSATITAIAEADTTRRGQAVIQIIPIVRDVDLQPSAASLFVGGSRQLAAQVRVDTGATASVIWRTSNAAVATVNGEGTVLAVGAGSAIISAISQQDTTMRATSLITVRNAIVVAVTPRTLTLNPGATRTLGVTVQADPGTNTALTWRSGNPQIATVDGAGRVTALAAGTTIIQALAVADTTRRSQATVTVVPAVFNVSLTPTTLLLAPTETRQLAATVTGDPGISTGVIWRTSNAAVATVSPSGLAVGVVAGTATITAISEQDTTMRATAQVTVRNAVLITVTPASLTINPGDVRTLAATVRADVGINTAVRWRSLDPQVATVDTDGRLTGVAMGNTVVQAISVADSTRSGQATVTVVPAVRDISLSPQSVVLAPGSSRQFSAVVTGDAGVSTAVLFRSSDPSIASISNTGLAVATRIGAVTITAIAAADTTRRATTTLTVRNAPNVSVSPNAVSMQTGQQRTIVATVTGDPGVSTAVTWSSANETIATVGANGVISAVAVGSTTVTATSVVDPTRQATVSVTVTPQVVSVAVSPSTLNLGVGTNATLTANVVAQGGLSTAVTWRSSNPAVASVNFSGTVAALSAGSATITVLSVADTTRRATAAVTVTTAPPPPPPATRLATSWSSSRLGGALYEDVVSLDAIDAANAFAVNSAGDVFRFNGSAWSLSTSGSAFGTQFTAISGTATSNVIAVGTNGVIARFNGTSWSPMSSGTASSLSGVWVESPTVAFAVGANGTALRFNGTAWSASASGTTQALNGVWSTGGVAVAVGSGGTMIRFSGSAWSSIASGTTETLYGVSGTSVNDVVAVGAFGTVVRFNGSSVVRLTSNTTADLYGISGTNPMYLAGDDGVRQLSGTTISTVSTPYAPRLFAVSTDNAGSVWTSGQRGTVMRVSGGSWSTLSLAPDLIDVWTTASNAAIAVGEFGSIFRWNGSTWTRQGTPTTATLNAVWSASATDAFAGGDNGTMLRWNGSSWSAMSFPSTSSVYGLWGSGSTNVYAVTSSGQIVRFNGSSWSVVATASAALWSIHGSSANDIVAGGESGTVLRFNGSSWTSLNASTTGTLAGIFALGPSSYLSVGANAAGSAGIAFLGSSGGWNATSTGSPRVLVSVWGTSATDVYATGEQGTILRYNGSSWATMNSGTADLLWSVSGASDASGGFAVGYNSTVSAATSGTGLVAAARSALVQGTPNLNPQRGAQLVRGPVPSGKAREMRRR